MQKLLEINEGEAMQSGLWPSLAPNQQALWKDGVNMEFADGRASKRGGWLAQGAATSGTVRALEQAYIDGLRRAFIATATTVYKFDTGVQSTIGSGFTGNGYWSMTPWGNWLLATDDFGVPQVWKNTGVMVPLAGVRRPRFRLVKKMQNHVLGFYGQSFDFSSKSNPELWLPAENNSAGDLFIRDLDSDIIAAQPMGQQMAVYSTDSMVLVNYVGAPFYFGATTAINGVGAISDSSIIPVGRQHYGLGPKGFFVTDGVGFKPIGSPAINRYLRKNIDWVQGRRCVGLHNERTTTIEWYFIALDGTVKGITHNYSSGAWGTSGMGFTAAAEMQTFDYPLVARDTTWGFQDVGANDNTGALSASIRSMPFDAGNRYRYKRWDMVKIDSERTGEVEVRWGFSDAVADEPDWSPWEPLDVENWPPSQDSVYLSVELRSTASGVAWDLGGLTVFGEYTAEAI